MASSSLNPDAPLFIPAAYRRVEDFSPEWWDLVHTTAWFRDHWFRHNHQLDDGDDDAHQLLPDTEDDLFYAPPDHHQQQQQYQEPTALRTLVPPRGAPWDHHHQQQLPSRHAADKPAQLHVGTKAAAATRFIPQPR